MLFTYIVSPSNFVWPRTGFDWALEVDIVAFLDVGSVQARPQGEGGAGDNWKLKLKFKFQILFYLNNKNLPNR